MIYGWDSTLGSFVKMIPGCLFCMFVIEFIIEFKITRPVKEQMFAKVLHNQQSCGTIMKKEQMFLLMKCKVTAGC